MSKKIIIIAGEASGDLHGANLASALRRAAPQVRLEGVGGVRMRDAGVSLLGDIGEMGVVGVVEVLAHWRSIWRIYRRIRLRLRHEPPDLLVLIDYPDFNFRVAKVARGLGIPVVYYISPQVWAWRRGRVKTLAKRIDKMLVIFPFEKELYEAAGVDCEFVGHPLLDELRPLPGKRELRVRLGLHPDQSVVALLPGSRRQEVRRLLPDMLAAMKGLKRKIPSIQPVIAVAAAIDPALPDRIVREMGMGPEVALIVARPDDVLAASDAAVVASGTATLQAAIHETPMVIVYRVSPVTYWLGRLLVRTDHIGMANVVAQERIVTELLQDQMTPEGIGEEVYGMLANPDYRDRIKKNLTKVRTRLGTPGASGRAARAILEFLRGGQERPRQRDP